MRWFFSLFIFLVLTGCGEKQKPPNPRLTPLSELVVLTRPGLTTYDVNDNGAPSGFEHDLVQLFADELRLTPRFVVVDDDKDVLKGLRNGEAQLGAAWLTPSMDPDLIAGPSYFSSGNIIVQNESAPEVETPNDLDNQLINVVSGSRQEKVLADLKKRFPNIRTSEHPHISELKLLEQISRQRGESALVDRAVLDIASNYYPQLEYSLSIGTEMPIVWLFPPSTTAANPELLTQANKFITKIRNDGTLARLTDRYFGHISRLSPFDSLHFLESIRTKLPKYRAIFEAAQVNTGIDWRLLAALSYQESQWNPLATSPTGVRGIMMLTEETADRLRVSNRLNPKESILAGAQYLADLRQILSPAAPEPDRGWLALAAYNLGMGHLNAARRIARQQGIDPNSWYEMKAVLPLLARPEYYSRLKSGKGRGGEAVILTENIRMYYAILSKYEGPYRPYGTTPTLAKQPLKRLANGSAGRETNGSSSKLPHELPNQKLSTETTQTVTSLANKLQLNYD